jgi:excisionase family DNA binding protein
MTNIDPAETQQHSQSRSDRPGRLAYSIPEAAAATGLGKTTLYSLISSGTLPSCKIGKRRIIASADLDALLQGHRRSSLNT